MTSNGDDGVTSNDTAQLSVSPRDVQFLVTMGIAYSTYINWLVGKAPSDAVEHNDRALDVLFAREFSTAEFNALLNRLKAALPADTLLEFQVPDGVHYVH